MYRKKRQLREELDDDTTVMSNAREAILKAELGEERFLRKEADKEISKLKQRIAELEAELKDCKRKAIEELNESYQEKHQTIDGRTGEPTLHTEDAYIVEWIDEYIKFNYPEE